MAEADPRHMIGANGPPKDGPDPLAELTKSIEDAYGEAKLWLDGEKVASQDQADALSNLYTLLDDAQKLAESTRVELKKPHLDAGQKIDGIYGPLRDKADKARKAVKMAVQQWNDHLAALAAIEAERIRKAAQEAEELALAQRAAARAANNFAAMEETEQQLDNAVTLAAMAKRVETAPIVTKRAGGRGIGRVPMHWVGRVIDRRQLLQHYMVAQPEALTVWLQEQLDRDVKAGSRAIPGATITEEKKL